MEKRNSQLEHGQPRLVLHVRLGCGSLSITNAFDVRSVLQGK